jgi:peptide subunit release factor 1 (eRF1)
VGAKERIGLINASIKITEISVKTGDFNDVVMRLTSGIPSQHHKGGQSQGRFLRKRQEAIKEYANRIKLNMKSVQVERWEYTGNKELVDMIK